MICRTKKSCLIVVQVWSSSTLLVSETFGFCTGSFWCCSIRCRNANDSSNIFRCHYLLGFTTECEFHILLEQQKRGSCWNYFNRRPILLKTTLQVVSFSLFSFSQKSFFPNNNVAFLWLSEMGIFAISIRRKKANKHRHECGHFVPVFVVYILFICGPRVWSIKWSPITSDFTCIEQNHRIREQTLLSISNNSNTFLAPK